MDFLVHPMPMSDDGSGCECQGGTRVDCPLLEKCPGLGCNYCDHIEIVVPVCPRKNVCNCLGIAQRAEPYSIG